MKDKKILKLIVIILISLALFYSLLLFFGSNIASLIYQTLFYGKYNTMFISEIVILLFSLIMLAIRKKLHILKQKDKGFIYSILRGMPILVISLIVFLNNILSISGEALNIPNLLSLIILAITIGMAEEFFFRGFIQDEIIKVYGKNRKQVIISIIISGVIFGLVHLTNVLSGQDIITTIMQVLQASSLGILLGSVYYLTKNIWSVVFLHAFYDFAILLGEVNSYKDCINNPDISGMMLLFTLIVSLVYVVIYLVGAYLNLQKRHINEKLQEDVSEKIVLKDLENAQRAKKLIVVVIVMLFLLAPLIPVDDVENSQICYSYEEISLNGEMSFSLNKDFSIVNNNLNYKLYLEDYSLVIENVNDSYVVELADNIYDLYVYEESGIYVIILNAGEKIYCGTIDINNFAKYDIKEFKNNLQVYDVPEIVSIGKLKSGEETYPILKSYVSDYFIIKDSQVMVLE